MPTTTEQNIHRLPALVRKQADFIVYVPSAAQAADAENQHFLVMPTRKGTFLAVWTQAAVENAPNQGIVVARSLDKGISWTEPVRLAGRNNGTDYAAKQDNQASWGFPFVVPATGRIYVFYNQNLGATDPREDVTGRLTFRYSEDDGITWSDPYYLPIGRGTIDNPDETADINWIVYQTPIITSQGEVMAGFTRWGSAVKFGETDLFKLDSEVWFLRFDNILTETDPDKLKLTTLPEGENGIRVASPFDPKISVVQEPSIQNLSDGRLICVMRTITGYIYYSLSSDNAHTWDEARPLRYVEGGEPLKQPIAPCPLHKTSDGKYILIFHHNDGTGGGGKDVFDYTRNRSPAYISIGREDALSKDQPVIFSQPKLLVENGRIPDGPIGRTEIATYTSYFEYRGKHYFWYPDRKHYLLGKILTEDLLDDSSLRK